MGKRSSHNQTSRRDFVKSTAALGVGFWAAGGVTPKRSLAANEEIRFACFGIGGKGSEDSANMKRFGKVVAVCDIDEEKLGNSKDKFPGAKQYYDYRKLFEEMGDEFDAVTVSTPDHTHALIASQALNMGKHCYCQKPLTHSIYEARLLNELAAKNKVVTQMGNQGTSNSTLRKSAALIQAGVIGKVKEVHVWTNRPVWPQGAGTKPEVKPVPSTVHWNEWIGPAPMRDYSPEIHPFKWRGLWNFGTGALGDMACHTLNMAFMALNLSNPSTVQAETDANDKEFFPGWSVIDYQFPALGERPAVKMVWYDGGRRPLELITDAFPKNSEKRHFNSAALLVGEKGMFYSPGDYGGDTRNTGLIVGDEFIPQRKIKDIKAEYTASPGQYAEFANAIKGEGETVSRFDSYACELTETVLLGNLAVWAAGHRVDWNKEEMKAKLTRVAEKAKEISDDEIANLIKHEYQNGYSL